MNDNYSIDYKGLAVGEYDFELPIEDSLFNLWEESEIKSGHGVAKIHLSKHSDMAEMSAELSGEVQVTCDRCLEEFMLPFTWSDGCIVRVTDDVPEDETDDLYISPSEEKLDLAQWLYESVILSLPYQWVHPDIKDCNPEMISRITIEK